MSDSQAVGNTPLRTHSSSNKQWSWRFGCVGVGFLRVKRALGPFKPLCKASLSSWASVCQDRITRTTHIHLSIYIYIYKCKYTWKQQVLENHFWFLQMTCTLLAFGTTWPRLFTDFYATLTRLQPDDLEKLNMFGVTMDSLRDSGVIYKNVWKTMSKAMKFQYPDAS